MKENFTVEGYITKHNQWERELIYLREIILSTHLQETIKWGGPVYTTNGKNIIGLGAFKSYVALWFFQGALLKDPEKKLINAQAGKTKALRQWRFGSQYEIEQEAVTIRKYINEAISNQQQGKSIAPDRQKPVVIPAELKSFLAENKDVNEKFDMLSKSKQREYAEYIAEAKRGETKLNRLAEIAPMILKGIGLQDKYRK